MELEQEASGKRWCGKCGWGGSVEGLKSQTKTFRLYPVINEELQKVKIEE